MIFNLNCDLTLIFSDNILIIFVLPEITIYLAKAKLLMQVIFIHNLLNYIIQFLY